MQDDGRRQFDAAVQKLAHSGSTFDTAAKTLHTEATSAIADVRASTAKLGRERRHSWLAWPPASTTTAARSTNLRRRRDKATAAADDLSLSSAALKRVAAETVERVSQSYAKISSDAANTTENVRTLAARLGDAIGSIDQRLSKKLTALDSLEQNRKRQHGAPRAKAKKHRPP